MSGPSSGKNPRLTLVLGGARSGKSVMAERLVMAEPVPWTYIATAGRYDDREMDQRIADHQARRGPGWVTLEAPIDLAQALIETADRPVLVDCLTLWLSNLMLGGHDVPSATQAATSALGARSAPCILVANEVGLGIVPDNALARAFRDEAGRLNSHMASVCDRVLFVAAGLPLTLKG